MTTEQMLDRIESRCVEAAEPAPVAPAPCSALPPVDLDGVHESVRLAHAATVRWVKDIANKRTAPYWLTLFGRSGCGKTLLSAHARDFLRRVGARAEFRNWPRVLEAIYHRDGGLLEQMASAPVLILDDVGAEYTCSAKTSQFSASKLYLLAEARQGKWTLLTSNLDYDGMTSELGARFASRVYRNNAVVVDMQQASDYSYEKWKLKTKK